MIAARGRRRSDGAHDGRWRRFVLRPDAGYAAGLEELHDLAHVSAWPRALAPRR